MTNKTDHDSLAKPSVQVLERMFILIDVLASREEAVSLKEISEKTGLHPSTTHRILNDLAIGRFVDRPESGSYRLGMRFLELGNLVKGRLSVREAALGPMRALHKQIHQPVNLSVRQGDEIVYVERAYSERSGMQVVRAIGGHAPLHLTSNGKLFLAADDPSACAPTPCAPAWPATPTTASPSCMRWSGAVQGPPVRHCPRQRGTGAGRALHGRRHLRRPGQAGGRPVDFRPGRPPGRRLAAQAAAGSARYLGLAGFSGDRRRDL
jgi:hypothetical protein